MTIWLKGVSPPSIHVHLRQFNVRKEVPLGKLDGTEGTEEEKLIFDQWLRARWSEKDLLMGSFLKEGKFKSTGVNSEESKKLLAEGGKSLESEPPIEWPVKLRYWYENLQAFSYFFPVFALSYLIPLVSSLIGSSLVSLGIVGTQVVKQEIKKPCGCAKMAAAAKLAKGEL